MSQNNFKLYGMCLKKITHEVIVKNIMKDLRYILLVN